MSVAKAVVEDAHRVPPRERIIAVACDLFYRFGIRGVGVEAIAEAANTNKMTLYRHFSSKDELVAECLREFARKAQAFWSELEVQHPGDPQAKLRRWLAVKGDRLADVEERGCEFCNAAVELPEKDHPARKIIEAFKTEQRERLEGLCREAGMPHPGQCADELFLLFEGARVSMQSVGREGPGARFVRMGEAIITHHSRGAA
jgi:AcrR family transcriptional regulator